MTVQNSHSQEGVKDYMTGAAGSGVSVLRAQCGLSLLVVLNPFLTIKVAVHNSSSQEGVNGPTQKKSTGQKS